MKTQHTSPHTFRDVIKMEGNIIQAIKIHRRPSARHMTNPYMRCCLVNVNMPEKYEICSSS